MEKYGKLSAAIELLTEKYSVIPEKYTLYNGAYLFVAYPKGIKDKNRCMNIHYLVDLRHKAVGPFSPVFDLPGFNKATENMKNL